MAQGSKSRVVIWTIVGILVVIAVVFLIIARKGAAPSRAPFSTDRVPRYVEQMDRRLNNLSDEAAELRGEYGPEEFVAFDSVMALARAGLEELQGLTDDNELRAKRDLLDGYREELRQMMPE